MNTPPRKSVYTGLFFGGSLLFTFLTPLFHAGIYSAQPDDKVLASVDEALITRSDLRLWLFETRLQNPETRTLPNTVLLEDLLQQAVEEELLYQGLWDPTRVVRDEDLEPIFEDNYNDFVQRARGKMLFKLRLEEAGIAENEFRPWLKERITRTITIENAITDRTLQEDSTILDELPNAIPNRYQLREIYIQAGNPKPLMSPTEADWLAAEKEIREIVVHLADNMTFEEAAKVFSDDTNTAPDGGMLGWFEKDALNAALLTELQKTPNGGITQPLRLEKGFSIYRIEAVTTEAQERLQTIRERIRQRLIQDFRSVADIQLAPGYTLTYSQGNFE
ncbi:MAG: peptidylprolyl isomerase [Sumerlaeia bacterium]